MNMLDDVNLGKLNRQMKSINFTQVKTFVDGFDDLFYHDYALLARSRENAKNLWKISPNNINQNNVWDEIKRLQKRKLARKMLFSGLVGHFTEEKIKYPKSRWWHRKEREPIVRNILIKKRRLHMHHPFLEEVQQIIDYAQRLDAYCLYLNIFHRRRGDIIAETAPKLRSLMYAKYGSIFFEPLYGEFWRKSENLIFYTSQYEIDSTLNILNSGAFVLKLAELLARLAESQRNVEEYIVYERIVKKQMNIQRNIPENTIGVTFGNNIQTALPHQLAMRHHRLMKKIFNLNFLEKRLLILEQEGRVITPDIVNVPVIQYRNLIKGPIIINIDTSGSMKGLPESIAKALTIAITNIATTTGRKCFVVGFNDNVKSFESATLGTGFKSLQKLFIQEFGKSTDINQAMRASVEKLTESDYRNSDILLISDMMVTDFEPDLKEQIMKAKGELIRFHALAIDPMNSNSNTKDNEIWDNYWAYNGTPWSAERIIADIENSFYNTVEKLFEEDKKDNESLEDFLATGGANYEHA